MRLYLNGELAFYTHAIILSIPARNTFRRISRIDKIAVGGNRKAGLDKFATLEGVFLIIFRSDVKFYAIRKNAGGGDS